MERILTQSKELKKNHLTVIIRTNNQQDAECVEKEFRAMLRRIKHHTDIDVSFEMFKNIRKNGGRLPACWNIVPRTPGKEVLYGKYTKGKGFMYITLSELIQIGIFLVGLVALLKSKK